MKTNDTNEIKIKFKKKELEEHSWRFLGARDVIVRNEGSSKPFPALFQLLWHEIPFSSLEVVLMDGG